MHPLGQTRTTAKANHAFIAPDGHVKSSLAGWTDTQATILISPHMLKRPRFVQYLAFMEENASTGQPLQGVQRFLYVMDGEVRIKVSGEIQDLSIGHFAYIPANTNHSITATTKAQLLIFEKPYAQSNLITSYPKAVFGDAWVGDGTPFMGDDNARVRTLLPETLDYDMAVNLFTFQTGTALPFVETHIMEHGLYLLEGQGIYRLDDDWYPIQAGDTIWMGSYCPQWFCAIGQTQSTYIYYKDVNRDPLAFD